MNYLLQVDVVVDELHRRGCICERHHAYIQGGEAEHVRNKRLVFVMTKRSIKDYRTFVECLRNKEEPIATQMVIQETGEVYFLIYI